jgi:hydrogenase maturation protein HypF
MLPTLEDVRRYCRVSEEEAQTLSSHQSPIVLLRRRADKEAEFSPPSPLSTLHSPPSIVDAVAPGNPYLGVMLPYTPLHHLLMAVVARPIVCTSGNLSDEPMAIAIEEALGWMGPIADALLAHDRPIVRPVDDSIVRFGADGPQVLRRARGFAPLPMQIDSGSAGHWPTVLAVGGHLKNTVALALGRARETRDERGGKAQVVMSAHVGDLDNVLSVGVFRRAIDDLLKFFQIAPDVVVCDLHPDYASTQYAGQLATRFDVPLIGVQHHHAHVASCMAEHGLHGPVLGFSWDGTGYGPDGTIWGGETLLCEGPKFQRVGRLRGFSLPGGDVAVRQPRRSALGLLYEMLASRAADYAAGWFSPGELDGLLFMLARRLHAPRTSSMGRLFDAVATLCGMPPIISFEGQAAMALEYAADENEEESYRFALDDDLILDWEPLLCDVLADRAAGAPVPTMSARFHNTLAEAIVAMAQTVMWRQQLSPELGRQFNCHPDADHRPNESPNAALPVVLTGGCFQNALLSARANARLSAAGFTVYTNKQVPPGDGGISLGQVFLALQQQ